MKLTVIALVFSLGALLGVGITWWRLGQRIETLENADISSDLAPRFDGIFNRDLKLLDSITALEARVSKIERR